MTHFPRPDTIDSLSPVDQRVRPHPVRDYAIVGLATDGKVTSWNSGAENIKKYRSEEIIGRHFSVFYRPEDVAAGVPEAELAAATEEGAFETEGWRVRKNGSAFWASVVVSALYDDEGKLRGFWKVTRDISARRAADQALRDSEEGFRLLVEGRAITPSWAWMSMAG